MTFSRVLETGRYWKTYLLSRYRDLSEQERLSVNVLGIVSFVAVFYCSIWQPLAAAAENARQAYSEAAELNGWIKAHGSEFKKIAEANSALSGTGSGKSILSIVTDSAQKNKIALTRFEPVNNQGLHIWLDHVPFDQLISWLYELDNQGIRLDSAQLERQIESGQVNAVITLK